MQEEVQQAETAKRCYQKPSLAAVRLFADNVLGESPCYASNQCTQSVMAPPS